MALRLGDLGFHDYRRSDALALRWLRAGPLPFASLTSAFGASRQSTRKVVSALVARGLAQVRVDAQDSRRRNVELTERGRVYAEAVFRVVHALNDDVETKLDTAQLEAARTALRFVTEHFGL